MDAATAKRQARELARRLIGETIRTVSQGKPNRIVAVDDKNVLVHAAKESPVSWERNDSIIDELFARATLSQSQLSPRRVYGGYRSAFIFALLSRTSFADVKRHGRATRLELRDT